MQSDAKNNTDEKIKYIKQKMQISKITDNFIRQIFEINRIILLH